MTLVAETNLCGSNATWAIEVDVPLAPDNNVASASGGSATLVYPPMPGLKYRIGAIHFSSDGTPLPGSNPLVTIRLSTGEKVFEQNISIFPLGQIIFKPPVSTVPGVGLTISISPAGVGRIVYLSTNVWAYSSQGTQGLGGP